MRSLLLVLATVPAPLIAESWTCAFSASCQTGRACLAADWAMELDISDDSATLRSARGDRALVPLGDGRFAGPVTLLSIRPGGVATLTLHDPPAESLLGDCTLN